jgi:hypothetical protein
LTILSFADLFLAIPKNKSAKDRIVKQFDENVVNISISENGSEIIK